MWMCHFTHMNASCHTCECAMSHMWMCTYMDHVTHECVMPHMWMCHVTHVNAQCHTYESLCICWVCMYMFSLCDTTHSNVWYGLFNTTHSNVCRNWCSKTQTQHIHRGSYAWHCAFIYVTQHIQTCDIVCVTPRIRKCDVANVVRHRLSIYIEAHMCGVSHSYMWHNTFKRVMGLVSLMGWLRLVGSIKL